MKKCIDCNKLLKRYNTIRCIVCYHKNRIGKHLKRISYKGKNNPNYIDGRTNKAGKCKGCEKLINYFQNNSKMCKNCISKLRTGKNNSNYKQGLFSDKLKHCLDCGKEIIYKSKRCVQCSQTYQKKENHPKWKGGLPKCSVCGKKLSTRGTENYKPRRCRKCCTNKTAIAKHHIDLNKQNNNKNNLLFMPFRQHLSLHHRAYNYLVKIGKVKQYIKWFLKQNRVI